MPLGGVRREAGADQGMMGRFLVVEPDRRLDLRRPEGDTDDHHDH